MQYDHILKKFKFYLGPTPLVHPTGSDQGLQTEIQFDMFYIFAALPVCKIAAKILTIALVIVKFKYLTFDPLGWVKGGGVKL